MQHSTFVLTAIKGDSSPSTRSLFDERSTIEMVARRCHPMALRARTLDRQAGFYGLGRNCAAAPKAKPKGSRSTRSSAVRSKPAPKSEDRKAPCRRPTSLATYSWMELAEDDAYLANVTVQLVRPQPRGRGPTDRQC